MVRGRSGTRAASRRRAAIFNHDEIAVPPLTIPVGASLIFLAALLYSSVGHAGASGYLAVMALLGTAPAAMRPTALVLNLFVATIGTVQFVRAGHFRWSLFWPFAIASIPAAYLGGRLSLPGTAYRVIVGGVLLLSAVRFVITLRAPDTATRTVSRPVALLVGLALGFLAGLTGVGGGIFLSPLLLLAGWAPLRVTAATSVTFILVNSAAGLLGQLPALSALADTLPLWAAAAVLGGVIGSHLGSRRLPSPALRALLAVVLLLAGTKLILAA
jgi:uncharacterized membrane protein YfcA